MFGFKIAKQTKGAVFGVLSALFVTGYVITNKHIYEEHNVDAIEYAIVFAVMGGVFAIFSLLYHGDRKKLTTIKNDYKYLIILGFVGSLAVAILAVGQKYTSSVNTALLITSSVLTTTLFSRIFLKVLPTKSQWFWMVGLFVGIYLGVVGFHKVDLSLGDVIILSSAIVFGLGNVLSKMAMRTHDPSTVADVRMIIGSIASILVGFFVFSHYEYLLDIAPFAILAGFFYWACMQTFARAVHLVGANSAIVLNQSQIFLTGILGALILSEVYNWEKFAGSVLAIVSIYFITKVDK